MSNIISVHKLKNWISMFLLFLGSSLSIVNRSHALSTDDSLNILMGISPLEILEENKPIENLEPEKPEKIPRKIPRNDNVATGPSQATASASALSNTDVTSASASAEANSLIPSELSQETSASASAEANSLIPSESSQETSASASTRKLVTPEPEHCEVFLSAVQNDQHDIVKKFLHQDIGLLECQNRHGQFPIHLAAEFASLKSLIVLMHYGSHLNVLDSYGNKPLDVALKMSSNYSHARVASVLIAAGSESPHDSQYFYLIPIFGFRDNFFQRFDFGNRTALHIASERDHAGFVKLLLKKGIPIDIIDDDGRTPLHAAVRGHALQVLNILLSRGCDPNISDFSGSMPIHTAFSLDAPYEIISILLEYGASANVTNIYGNTPIILNVIWNLDTDITSELIKYSAKLDKQNDFGDYALLEAVRRQNIKLIRFLLQRGADPCLINHKGESALSLATDIGGNMATLFASYSYKISN